ncbi:unnamed protein product, partial [Ectocarpus sp. 8 AP-2014]
QASGSTRARPRSISDRHDSLRQNRGGGGTGNVSPEGVDSTYQKKPSLRGSAAVSGHQHGKFFFFFAAGVVSLLSFFPYKITTN